MIFLGDIACPNEKVNDFISSVEQCRCLDDEVVMLNLEATFVTDVQNIKDECLFNSKSVLDGFKNTKKIIVSLANNHMYDYPERIQPTVEYLESKGVGVFGLCKEDGDSFEPYVYNGNDGKVYALFGHCWRLYTNTNTNNINKIRVVDHSYEEFVKRVSIYCKANPDQLVYCYMHWNYDLEKLPFPMHIQIAHDLIDGGVSGVIGSHSHRPHGAEIYKGKPIVYGLGNFYIPSGIYFDGKLSYPECSKDTYGLIVKDDITEVQWFRTDDGKAITETLKESINGEKIMEFSPFALMQYKEYVSYFKKNRVKKLLVPVFDEYKGKIFNIKEIFAITRVKILRKLL